MPETTLPDVLAKNAEAEDAAFKAMLEANAGKIAPVATAAPAPEIPAGDKPVAPTEAPQAEVAPAVEAPVAEPSQVPEARAPEPLPVVPAELDALKARLAQLEAKGNADAAYAAKWKGRYYTLRGKVYAEVPRTAAENKEVRQENKELRQENAELKARQGQTAPGDPLAGIELTDADKELEQGYVSVAARIARQVAAETERRIRAEYKAQPTQNTGEVPPERRAFYGELAELVPDSREVDTDPSFQAWLDGRDIGAASGRRHLIKEADARNDALAIADIVDAWRETQPDGDAAAAPVARPPAPAPAALRRPSVAEQVALPTRAAVPAPRPVGKPWTLNEWVRISDLIARGGEDQDGTRWVGPRAELMAKELVLAEKERRIRPD